MISFLREQITAFLQNFAAGFVAQYTFIILFYVVVWVFFARSFAKRRIQTQKRAGWAQIRDEFKNGIWVLVVNVITTPLLINLSKTGYVKIYEDVHAYGGVWYVVFTIVFMLLVSDAWFYWMHRWLHTPKLYQYIHAVHHKSLDTTPFTTLSFHIAEAFLQTAFVYALIFVMPINTLAIGVVQILGLLNNIKSHLGYEFYPSWFAKTPLKHLVNSTHHNLHHTRYNGNYGLFFTFWDRWAGTEFADQNQRTEEIASRPTAPVIVDNSQFKTLTIARIERETSEVVSVYFQTEDKAFYHYKPGQYINLRFALGWNYDRAFSLSSSPLVDDFLRITVKKHAVVTEYLHTEARVGDKVQALYPTGEFYLEPVATAQRHYLLVAGGSGITPLYSMLRSVLQVEQHSSMTLLYASRAGDGIIFGKELAELEKEHAQLTVQYFIRGKNRLQKSDLAAVLEKHPDSQIFICGPDGLKRGVKTYMKELQATTQVHEEDYVNGYVPFWWRSARGLSRS